MDNSGSPQKQSRFRKGLTYGLLCLSVAVPFGIGGWGIWSLYQKAKTTIASEVTTTVDDVCHSVRDDYDVEIQKLSEEIKDMTPPWKSVAKDYLISSQIQMLPMKEFCDKHKTYLFQYLVKGNTFKKSREALALVQYSYLPALDQRNNVLRTQSKELEFKILETISKDLDQSLDELKDISANQ